MLNRLLWIVAPLCVALLAAGCEDSDGTGSAAVTDVSPARALELIEAHQGDPTFVILDVRTPAEFAGDRISGAVNADALSPTFLDQLLTFTREKTYLVYCGSGGRSRPAVETMANHGFRAIYHLVGGLTAFRATIPPTTRLR